ncbi:hypothetical protein STCU_10697 [Strigomonas culicis]|uniref:Uncharacterized protein n=1 Tax=Strigomonas culicis TaxID=28005 RepID=S9TGV2_9TRYP|nr:hypothetical protein STCU_10697 [Strigomonas culicis]|eukprot:EPY17292.1 hypothetical protein STCU_10697 [Strigomonas culicis]
MPLPPMSPSGGIMHSGRASDAARNGVTNNSLPDHEDRVNNSNTKFVASDADGGEKVLDSRPFNAEKVNRVPTKACLKPPKNANSLIADPDDDDYDYEGPEA